MLTWTDILGLDWVVHAQSPRPTSSGVFDTFTGAERRLGGGRPLVALVRPVSPRRVLRDASGRVRIVPRKYHEGEEYLDQRPSDYLR